MKRYTQLIASFTLLCLMSNIFAELQINRGVTATPGGTTPSFHYITGISVADFRNAGAATLTKTLNIATAGYYTLVQDIDFEGTGDAITITGTGDVVIDLGGRTIFGTNNSNTVSAIDIATTVDNVTIKNGNIVDFEDAAIAIAHNCKAIRLENLCISNCTNNGVKITGTSGNISSEVTINNCIISNTVKTSGESAALEMTYCENITVSNCVFGSTAATSGDAIGVKVTLSENISFINCDASGSTATTTGAGYGFYVANACENISFENCTAHNNSGLTISPGVGFAIVNDTTACRNCSFIDCVASGNSGGTTGHGCGFQVDTAHENYFENCRASYNTSGSSGYGFFLNAAQNNIYKSCTAIGNKSTSTSGVDDTDGGHGFSSITGTGNSFEKCLSVGNLAADDSNATLSAGFFASGENNSIWLECEARANGSNGSSEDAAGFYIQSTSDGCLFDSCRSISNESSGATAYGFYDSQGNSSTSLIIDCLAFANTGNTSTNYSWGTGVSVNSTYTSQQLGSLTSRNPFENVQITRS